MYNSLRLLLVLLVAPILATAQANNNAPCPDMTIDLSGLAELKALNLENLTDAKQLAKLENLAELKGLADIELLLDQTLDLNSEAAAYDAEKRKTIDKTFKVSSKDVLKIDNQWGKVHVNTWDKNEIRVKVDVVTHASTEAKAQEMLDNIKIMESREGNTYTFRTQKDIRISGNNKQGLEINYTVYMPAENGIAVKNRFGDVYLPSMKGKADIDLQYGNLKCDRLANSENTVKISFGSGNCGYVNGVNLDVAYTDMKVGEAAGLQGTSKFCEFSVGSLQETMEMDLSYGSFKVDNISNNIRRISLDSGFTPVSLRFADNAAFNFDVNVKFGNFNVDKSLVTITSLEKGYTSAEYKGKFGGTSPKGMVSITSKYGDVKFTK